MAFEEKAYERLYEKPMDQFERDLAGRRFAILDEEGTGYVHLREFQNHQAMKVLEKKGKVSGLYTLYTVHVHVRAN